jgi:hypothetical protein
MKKRIGQIRVLLIQIPRFAPPTPHQSPHRKKCRTKSFPRGHSKAKDSSSGASGFQSTLQQWVAKEKGAHYPAIARYRKPKLPAMSRPILFARFNKLLSSSPPLRIPPSMLNSTLPLPLPLPLLNLDPTQLVTAITFRIRLEGIQQSVRFSRHLQLMSLQESAKCTEGLVISSSLPSTDGDEMSMMSF